MNPVINLFIFIFCSYAQLTFPFDLISLYNQISQLYLLTYVTFGYLNFLLEIYDICFLLLGDSFEYIQKAHIIFWETTVCPV
eukprot:snap_masked-scaffold_19-processed-gene-4.28-mRNA-1 protein AED:1.00 eAED:1.00 QI:0/0/0/0/1/1/2/0/81